MVPTVPYSSLPGKAAKYVSTFYLPRKRPCRVHVLRIFHYADWWKVHRPRLKWHSMHWTLQIHAKSLALLVLLLALVALF